MSFNIIISCRSICHGTVDYIYNDVNRHWITTGMNNFEHHKIYIIVNFYCYANVVKLGKVLIFRCLSMFFWCASYFSSISNCMKNAINYICPRRLYMVRGWYALYCIYLLLAWQKYKVNHYLFCFNVCLFFLGWNKHAIIPWGACWRRKEAALWGHSVNVQDCQRDLWYLSHV